MSVLFVVVPVALVVVLAAVLAFRWAARHGQFDDLSTPPVRALHDDVTAAPKAGTGGSGAAGANEAQAEGSATETRANGRSP